MLVSPDVVIFSQISPDVTKVELKPGGHISVTVALGLYYLPNLVLIIFRNV